ncbi:MAG: FAD-dependent oxidoreductase [Sedimentisphaerales bacterium]
MPEKDEKFDIVVAGGGIVGLAAAYKIASNHPDVRIAVMEKEKTLCYHQTGHNSGVIHSGLYYKPGSAKAKNCTRGRKELVSFAKKYKIHHEICGKVIVATSKKELPHLERIYNNGCENEIEGIEKISPEKIKEIEPYVINCAGLQSDRIAQADGIWPDVRIIPFRGDYYELNNSAKEKVKHLIYPVPDPTFPFLGVHFTRMIKGNVECGPNAVFSFKREGYGKTDFDLKDAWQSLSYFGTWKMFLKHWHYGLNEYARAFSKKLFLRGLQRLVPSLSEGDITPCKSGVRAQAVARNGKPVDDFKIEKGKNSIHVLNAPSPAATASLAIGEYINELATEHFKLNGNSS